MDSGITGHAKEHTKNSDFRQGILFKMVSKILSQDTVRPSRATCPENENAVCNPTAVTLCNEERESGHLKQSQI